MNKLREIVINREAWWAVVQSMAVTELDTAE